MNLHSSLHFVNLKELFIVLKCVATIFNDEFLCYSLIEDNICFISSAVEGYCHYKNCWKLYIDTHT